MIKGSANIVVFISHNKQDKSFAREIGLFLVAENISVWFDEWEIGIGDSITEKVNKGLEACTHLIILWSKSASESEWVRKEVFSTIATALLNKTPKIIPVRLDDTPLPTLLSDLKYHRYRKESKIDQKEIVSAVSGNQPSQKYIKAVVKKFHELVEDEYGEPILCPSCGHEKLVRKLITDWNHGDDVAEISCPSCGWRTYL